MRPQPPPVSHRHSGGHSPTHPHRLPHFSSSVSRTLASWSRQTTSSTVYLGCCRWSTSERSSNAVARRFAPSALPPRPAGPSPCRPSGVGAGQLHIVPLALCQTNFPVQKEKDGCPSCIPVASIGGAADSLVGFPLRIAVLVGEVQARAVHRQGGPGRCGGQGRGGDVLCEGRVLLFPNSAKEVI